MPIGSRLRRLLWLLPLGVILAPLAGYMAGIALPQLLAVWIVVLFLKLITLQFGAVFEVLAVPAIYGAKWAWPVTCVVLPAASLLVQQLNRSTFLALLGVGGLAGALTGYIGAAIGADAVKPDSAYWFAFGGLLVGAACGAIFAAVLRRVDRRQRRSQESAEGSKGAP